MAAGAAWRCGTGLVSVVTRAEHRPAILARCPEVMVQNARDEKAVAELLERATALAIGPGIGRGGWAERLFARAVSMPVPMVIDADGLRWLADLAFPPGGMPVITPHPAEAAHLLRTSVAAVESDRPRAALALAGNVGGVAVLKGPGTVCAADRLLDALDECFDQHRWGELMEALTVDPSEIADEIARVPTGVQIVSEAEGARTAGAAPNGNAGARPRPGRPRPGSRRPAAAESSARPERMIAS